MSSVGRGTKYPSWPARKVKNPILTALTVQMCSPGWTLTSLCAVGGAQSGNGTRFYSSTSASPSHYHSTNATCTPTHLPATYQLAASLSTTLYHTVRSSEQRDRSVAELTSCSCAWRWVISTSYSFLIYPRNSVHFMEPASSLPFSPKPATCPYPEPDESNPRSPILFL